MARTQTMVQLTDRLIDELDREAARLGASRSAVIRAAISAYLAEQSQATDVRRYVEGYRAKPPGLPDEWGDLESGADSQGRETALRLDAEDRAAGLEW
ncbi:MAG: ribbon-helix-helix protein, CopG family [Actinobacteria bacterium]|nr:ribbon-helix-helix protein, CopG family [Actinomycetota bacterium]